MCYLFTIIIIIGYNIADAKGPKFLSWQTWDLLRITWYGYKGFCEEFIQRNPGYGIYPLRLTGSAVETIFSRLKFITGGNLSGVNYSSSRANLITRYDVHGRHTTDEYRDAPLYVRDHQLTRRMKNKNESDDD